MKTTYDAKIILVVLTRIRGWKRDAHCKMIEDVMAFEMTSYHEHKVILAKFKALLRFQIIFCNIIRKMNS